MRPPALGLSGRCRVSPRAAWVARRGSSDQYIRLNDIKHLSIFGETYVSLHNAVVDGAARRPGRCRSGARQDAACDRAHSLGRGSEHRRGAQAAGGPRALGRRRGPRARSHAGEARSNTARLTGAQLGLLDVHDQCPLPLRRHDRPRRESRACIPHPPRWRRGSLDRRHAGEGARVQRTGVAAAGAAASASPLDLISSRSPSVSASRLSLCSRPHASLMRSPGVGISRDRQCRSRRAAPRRRADVLRSSRRCPAPHDARVLRAPGRTGP